jgi:hypothetical protein
LCLGRPENPTQRRRDTEEEKERKTRHGFLVFSVLCFSAALRLCVKNG